MTIFQSITAAMGDIEPIAKGRRNDKQGFNFRGIDDIMSELQPVLVKHGLFVVPEALEVIREQKQSTSGGVLLYSIVKMKYTFFAADGSNVSAVVIGEGMDSGDKASNKAMAVAMKYALLQVFCIPTEDAKDPDAESHSVATGKAPKPENPKQVEFQSLVTAIDENKIPVYDETSRKAWREMAVEKGFTVTIAALKKDLGITQ